MSGGIDRCIGGWIKHSFIDFPGTVSAVLFFRGCNLRCPYCHNPELACGTAGTVAFEEILAYLRQRSGIIEGVVLSGGEPTLHEKELPLIVRELRALGLTVKLDTNGLFPGMITTVAPDYCALDLKTTPSRYPELGDIKRKGEHPLLRSLAIIREMGKHAEVRITVAHPFIDDTVIDEFTRLLDGMETVFLQPFRWNTNLLDGAFGAGHAVPEETLFRYRDRLARVVHHCTVRGT